MNRGSGCRAHRQLHAQLTDRRGARYSRAVRSYRDPGYWPASRRGVHQTQRVDRYMALLALDFLARIVSRGINIAPPFSAFHALAINDGGRGHRRLSRQFLALERVMDTGQHTVAVPFDKTIVHGALGRKIPRRLAPLAAGGQPIGDRIQNLAPVEPALRRQKLLDRRPFLVRYIARIALRYALVIAPVLRRPHRLHLQNKIHRGIESQVIPTTHEIFGQPLTQAR